MSTTTATSIFPWVTDKNQFSAILTSSEVVFAGHNDTPRQRYIGWRLWSLQKSSKTSSEPKFYFQETFSAQDEYSDDDNEEYNSSLSMMTRMLPKQEGDDDDNDKEITLHHCPSHFNNLNQFMLN